MFPYTALKSWACRFDPNTVIVEGFVKICIVTVCYHSFRLQGTVRKLFLPPPHTGYYRICHSRVPTSSGNYGKPGKSPNKVPYMEKSWKGYFHLCPLMDFLQTLHINNSLYTNYENVFIESDS